MSFLTTLGRGAAALALSAASLAAQAYTVTLNFDGDLATSADVDSFNFAITGRSDVSLWTDSANSSFDPVLALFDRDSGALLAISDDVDNPEPQVHAGQGPLDAGLRLTDLLAGRYRVAISASPNLPLGATWADGYSLASGSGMTLGTANTWSVNISITESAPLPAVPEPTTYALMLAGLLSLGFMAHRQSRKR